MSCHTAPTLDRIPPKRDVAWPLGFSPAGAFAEPDAGAGRPLMISGRETVHSEGDEARCVYLIIEGAVTVSKVLPDGRRQIAELIGPGDVFGITSTGTHDVSADTLGPCRLVSYERRQVEESPVLQRLIAERMRAQICDLHDHAVLLGRKTARERVATFLMRLLPGRGGSGCTHAGDTDAARVRVPLSRQEVADYLGLTLETVSRAFSRLKRDGLVAYDHCDDVTIPHVRRLRHVTGAV